MVSSQVSYTRLYGSFFHYVFEIKRLTREISLREKNTIWNQCAHKTCKVLMLFIYIDVRVQFASGSFLQFLLKKKWSRWSGSISVPFWAQEKFNQTCEPIPCLHDNKEDFVATQGLTFPNKFHSTTVTPISTGLNKQGT